MRFVAPAARPGARTAWRPVLIAAALVAAAAHVPVTGEHLEEAFYIGALFIALEVACVALTVALLVRPSRLVVTAVAVVGALAVLALVVSRTVGLPLIEDDIGVWTEPLAVISLVAELLMTVGGVAALAGRTASPRSPLAGLATGVLVLAVGAVAIGIAVGTGTGSHDEDAMPGMSHDMAGMHMEGDAH